MLAVAQYFDRADSVEADIRQRVERLWREMEWSWYLKEPDADRLVWHWSPDHGWAREHRIGDHFNECQIAYILAIASPTHPIPADRYYRGWTGEPPNDAGYRNGKEYYGIKLDVGWPFGGPLFFTHYSYLGLDPRAITDRYTNYYDNHRAYSRIHHAHCVKNPKNFKGYGPRLWGLTASLGPEGYRVHDTRQDDGTITPTAAISAMPYTPELSLGRRSNTSTRTSARRCGARSASGTRFNLQQNWFADAYIAIDHGTMVPMIENYRTQFCWRLFMQNEDVRAGLKKASIWNDAYDPAAKIKCVSPPE